MKSALHFKSNDMVFSNVKLAGAGTATVSRIVGPHNSKTIDAGIATYDGCSIERKTKYDEAIVVLEGTFRLITGESFDRVINAKFGDVIWLTKGTKLKYEGDKAKVFYARYPVTWEADSDSENAVPPRDVYHFRATDMTYSQIQIYSGGYSSTCSLVTPAISTTLAATIATYDRSSVDWTTEYDQVSVVLGGTMLIHSEEAENGLIEAKLGDVVWLPEGTHLKYGGDRAVMFFVPYPVDWRLRGQPVRPQPWPASVR